MSGKIRSCEGPFYVYKIEEFEYVGVTTNLRARANKHKSSKGLSFKPTLTVLESFNDYHCAIQMEENIQDLFALDKRNVLAQSGGDNHYAKGVLDKETGLFFDSIKEACLSLNLVYGSARNYISNNNYRLIKIN
jgi:predicted GIY-YIG superfamily endonuclease